MTTSNRPPLPAFAPHPEPDDAPFWEAAAEGRLVLPRCQRLRNLHLVPAHVLPRLPHDRSGLGRRPAGGARSTASP